MLAYLVRRLGQNLVTLFLIVTLAFFLVQAQPGDYTSVYAQDPKLTPEVRAQIQADFGLDKPWESSTWSTCATPSPATSAYPLDTTPEP